MKKPERTHCNKPDREVPRIVCGYPLPCPYHTIEIDTATGFVAFPPESMTTHRQRVALRAIGEALTDKR